ncbi:hypothetical protein OEZ85_007392 [Tetradesmus obliquus]|uniref:Protein kinase domain-containing protein n=1 Tax=Tetradesmus obliquus TaxID=3088 RepID=A0ABY8THN1_TETOB|nr:hypothetical protein OEZ85_007392 [Tetradesmus obliquus]
MQKVRAVVAVGGTFRPAAGTASWEYVGDITHKVVGIPRAASYAELQALLANRSELDAGLSSVNIKYALPGSTGTFIEVTTDEDLQDMWDEWDDFTADSSSKGARLQLYISRPRSSSASSSGGSPWQTLNSSRLLHMGSWQPPTPTLDEDAGDMAACLAQAALEQRSKAAGSAAPFKGSSSSAFGGAAAGGSTKSSLRSSKSSSNAGSIPDTQSLIASSSVRFAADVAPGDAAAGGAQPGQQCAACISLKTAAVLATIAEHQGGSAARAGSLTSSSSFSAPQPVRRLPGRRQTSPDLQQIVKQLKVQVEMIMPHELEVLRFIASGAFGDVFLARWHGTEVAVKCLSSNLLAGSSEGGSSAAGSAAAADLMQEASMLAALHHPNIVAVYGFVPPPQDMLGRCSLELPSRPVQRSVSASAAAFGSGCEVCGPAIVSEYMAAGSLHSALANQAEWLKSSMARVKVLLDTARGLSYLHSKAVTHFDLKTANLLFTIKDRTPIVKVADFGLAKRRQQTYVTGVDSLRGTLPWIAPEVIQHPESVTEAADIYSLGIIAWQLWTFQEPFEDVPFHTLLHQLSTQGALRLALPGSAAWGEEEPAPPEPAPGYSQLMQRCWSVDPADRPSSRQLVGELQEMLVALKRNKG